MTKAEIRVMPLQAKQCQGLPASLQQLGDRPGTDSLSEGTNPAETVSDF